MAQDIVNKLQTLSYTSKDFNSIYPELLNTVKQLTYKWDPTISNESDPGVLLLKLNAIIADKCNYNIDTAVLECFPLSVTQQRNARQLFEQLGYYMHWYKSATTNVALKWAGTIDPASTAKTYTIPAFTMVTNTDSNIVYTLIGPSDVATEDSFIVQNTKLSTTGETLALKAIEGTVSDFSVNGSTLITSNLLDSNNRLYFSVSDVAENGIFIHNLNLDNYDEWKRKDNLLVEAINENNKFYKFGVAQDTATCYLEFPDNAAEIIRDGIYIKYIRSTGETGNISYKVLEKFYTNFSPIEDENITLSSDNVKLYNIASGVGGSNFETINDAYKGYKTTVGTFNTLVTIRDYLDAFINNKLASNGFVCDRNDDIQSTHDIMSSVGGIDQHITQIDKTTETTYDYYYDKLTGADAPTDWGAAQGKYYDKTNDVFVEVPAGTAYVQNTYWEKKISETHTTYSPDLTAFSLKCYLLKYANLNTVYSNSLIEDFETTFTPYTNNELYAVESYIEDMKLISHDYVDILPSTTQKSHFCYFKNVYPLTMTITPQYTLSAEDKDIMRKNILSALYSALNATEIKFGEEISFDLLLQTIQNADSRIKNVSLGNVNYVTYAVYWDGQNYQSVLLAPTTNAWYVKDSNGNIISNITIDEIKFTAKQNYDCLKELSFTLSNSTYQIEGTEINTAEYGISDNSGASAFSYIIAYSKNNQFIDELYAKSVLNGTTQFFIKDEIYDYKLNQEYTAEYVNVNKVSTNVDISLGQKIGDNTLKNNYTLKSNEYLQFLAPNFKNNTLYTNYVKYEYRIYNNNKNIESGTNYKLNENEYIAFYWKDSVDADALYNYYIYGAGNYICPTFLLECTTSSTSTTNYADTIMQLYGTPEGDGSVTSPIYYSSAVKNIMTTNISSNIGNFLNANLSGTKTVTIKQENSILLTSGLYCYWILNNKTNENKYILFDSTTSEYTLKENEYFIYSNENLEELVILGSGTKLIRTQGQSTIDTWEVTVLDYEKIFDDGSSALAGYWFYLPQNQTLQVIEQQRLTLVPNMSLIMQLNNYAGTATPYFPLTSRPSDWHDSTDIPTPPAEDVAIKTKYYKKSNNEFIHVTSEDTWETNKFYEANTHTYTEGQEQTTIAVSVTVDSATFAKKCQSTANFIAKFSYSPNAWHKDDTTPDISLEDYGLTYTAPAGYHYTFEVGYSTNWQIDINSNQYTLIPSSLSLSDFSIYYKNSTSSAQTKIDATIMGSDSSTNSWTVVSKLVLDISALKEQKLLEHQTITLIPTSGDSIVITGNNLDNNTYGTVLMANTEVLLAGANQNIPTTYDIETGLYSPAKIYLFKEYTAGFKASDNTVSNRVAIGADNISFTFLTNDYTNLYIKNKLPAGEYIVAVKIPELPPEVTGVSILQNETALPVIYNSGTTSFRDPYTYFVYYKSDGSTPSGQDYNKFIVQLSTVAGTTALSKSFVITIGNIYKFNYPDNLNNYIYTATNDYLDTSISDYTNKPYNVGDCVRHSGYYVCKTAIGTGEDWNATKWALLTAADTNLAAVKAEIYAKKTKLLLNEFDPNHYFNYTFTVPEDVLIKDPTDPASFFNTNHIYNEFTIAQYKAVTAVTATNYIKILG